MGHHSPKVACGSSECRIMLAASRLFTGSLRIAVAQPGEFHCFPVSHGFMILPAGLLTVLRKCQIWESAVIGFFKSNDRAEATISIVAFIVLLPCFPSIGSADTCRPSPPSSAS